jgi:hypothetical protein
MVGGYAERGGQRLSSIRIRNSVEKRNTLLHKTIAVDVDDTLNNYSEMLQITEFPYEESYGLTPDIFHKYHAHIKSGEQDGGELLCTEYSYFKIKIQIQCHQLAQAKPDAVTFMQWLKANNWRIIICTYRDLRRSDYTQQWLLENRIPYDYIFSVHNKIVFCKMWRINHLIDDEPLNILYGATHGVNVYYPVMGKHRDIPSAGARGFHTFEEVKHWIQK